MDLYVVLGLQHGASESDIKRAYRRLARRFHPDINPGDRMAEARFRQILEAYETLIDPDRRSRYDTGGHDGPRERRVSGFEGFDFSARGVDYSASFGDLFAEVLSERGGKPRVAERGADLHQTIQLTFDDALAGVQRALTVTRRETCRTCAGGGLTRAVAGTCALCQGTGAVRSVRGHMVFAKPCSYCRGTGEQADAVCPGCSGHRMTLRSESVMVNIPAGLSDGARVRVPGKGHAGRVGGESGDLLISIRVDAHPVFRREGDDLHVLIPVAVHEAALGARIEFDALDGVARLRLPPGSQSGQRFRLRERGAPSPTEGGRGDLVVEIVIVLPPALDERSKELLREFGRLNGTETRRPALTAPGLQAGRAV